MMDSHTDGRGGKRSTSSGEELGIVLEKTSTLERSTTIQTKTTQDVLVDIAHQLTSETKVELREEDCYDKLGFCFPKWKKWLILSAIFAVQTSMNFNASVYGNAILLLPERYGITLREARYGQLIFLVAYAFGCEFWAPWSEELGRKRILQASLALVNIWQILCGLAPSHTALLIGRFLGGLSSAGGSVTLGMVADMWEPEEHQYAVAFVVLSSVMGSVIGPVCGGFIQQYLPLQWNFWIQLLLGVVVQIIHFILVPETRSSVLCKREAQRRRKHGEPNVYATIEIHGRDLTVKHVAEIWARPFWMFITEPIVLCLSLLSGFSDALIFTFLESYGPVYRQWKFTPSQIGLAFIPIGIGYVIAYLMWFPFIHRVLWRHKTQPQNVKPEIRLFYLLWTAPLLCIGLFGFAWTSLGPPYTPWIAPMLFSTLIGIANFAIYGATIDYMVLAYRMYAASATGGNGFARDFLAGIAALYAHPLYKNLGGRWHLSHASTLLGCLAFVFTIPIYIFYWYGPQIRAKSKFACELEQEKKVHDRLVAKSREMSPDASRMGSRIDVSKSS